MRNPGGQATIFFADGARKEGDIVNFDGFRCERVTGSTYEADTFSCHHCNSIVHVPHRADVNEVGFCRNCMKPICAKCSDQACVPFERKLAEAEDRAYRARGYGF